MNLSTQTVVGSKPSNVAEAPSSAGFVELLVAYRASGGTARGEDLARLMEEKGHGGYVGLAKAIVRRSVFGFVWKQTFWLPIFQFAARDLAVHRGLGDVIAALPGDLDSWETAVWFAQPLDALKGQAPADAIGQDFDGVLQSARDHRSDRSCGSNSLATATAPLPVVRSSADTTAWQVIHNDQLNKGVAHVPTHSYPR